MDFEKNNQKEEEIKDVLENVKEEKEEVFNNEEEFKKIEEEDLKKTSEVKEGIEKINEATEESNEIVLDEEEKLIRDHIINNLVSNNQSPRKDVHRSYEGFTGKIIREFKEKYFPKKKLSKEEIVNIVDELPGQIFNKLKEEKEHYNDQNEGGLMEVDSIKRDDKTGEYKINTTIRRNYSNTSGSHPVPSETINYTAKVEGDELIWKE